MTRNDSFPRQCDAAVVGAARQTLGSVTKQEDSSADATRRARNQPYPAQLDLGAQIICRTNYFRRSRDRAKPRPAHPLPPAARANAAPAAGYWKLSIFVACPINALRPSSFLQRRIQMA